MIYLTMGVPSRFSEWCEAILRELLIEADGQPPEVFGADTLDQIGGGLLSRRITSALVVSRMPQKKLMETVNAARSPVIVTLDTPQNAVNALMRDHNESFPNAVRRVANCLTSLLHPTRYARALVLRAFDNPVSESIAESISDHFELGLDRAAVGKAAARVPAYAPEPPTTVSPGREIIDGLEARAALREAYGYKEEGHETPLEIQAAVLEPLWAHLTGGALQEMFWHPALFFHGDRPSEPATGPIDVTGTRRCLFFGPYIQLPEGAWTCNLLLGCAKSAVGIGLTLDVFAGATLNSVDVEVMEPGLFEIAMSFVNPNPDAQLEVRLFSVKPNFEGNILPGSVRLTPQRASRLRAD